MDKKIKNKLNLKKTVILVGAAAVIIGGGVSIADNKEKKTENETISVISEQSNQEIKSGDINSANTETAKIEEIEKLPEYKIEKIDNSNIGSVIRETLHIVVNGEYTKDQLYKIAEKEIKDYTAKHNVNALTVGFYESANKIGNGYEMGRVEYVPNGNFADATKVKAGDYSKFQYVNYIQDKLYMPEPKPVEVGTTDLKKVKEDFETNGYKNSVGISKNGDTLKVVVNEKKDLQWKMPGTYLISTYTDFCLDNIKNDIKVIDITVNQPSDNARAVLNMSQTQDDGLGRYFDEDYINANLK